MSPGEPAPLTPRLSFCPQNCEVTPLGQLPEQPQEARAEVRSSGWGPGVSAQEERRLRLQEGEPPQNRAGRVGPGDTQQTAIKTHPEAEQE